MRGRGLLIAAAVIQFVGAGIFLISGLAQFVIGTQGPHTAPLVIVGGASIAIASVYIAVSTALLGCRRWAWIASLALDGLSAASLISAVILGRVGIGELIIVAAIIGAPLFVTLGLLIGGRHAVSSTAAAPPAATPSGG